MLLYSLILLLLSNAVTLRRDKSTLYNRVTLSILVVTCYIIYDSTYISFIDKGISLFGGSFHLSSIIEVFHLFVLFLTIIIFTLTILIVTCYITYGSTYLFFIKNSCDAPEQWEQYFQVNFQIKDLIELQESIVFYLALMLISLGYIAFLLRQKKSTYTSWRNNILKEKNIFSDIMSPLDDLALKKALSPLGNKNTNKKRFAIKTNLKHVNTKIDLLYEKPVYKLLLSYLTCFLLKKNKYKYNKNDYNKMIKNSYNHSYPNSLIYHNSLTYPNSLTYFNLLTYNLNNRLTKNNYRFNNYKIKDNNLLSKYNEIQGIMYLNMNYILVYLYNKKKEHFVLSKVFIYFIIFTFLFVIFNLIYFNSINLFHFLNLNLFIINYFYRFMKKYINNELIFREFLFAFLLMFSKLTNFSSLLFFFKDLMYIFCSKLWYYIKNKNRKIICSFILFLIFKGLLIYYFDFKNTTFIETINYALSTYFFIYTFMYFLSVYIVGFKREAFTLYSFFLNFKVEGFLIYLSFLYLTPYVFILNLFNKYILPIILYTKLDFLTVFLENLNRFLDLPIRKDKVINTEELSNYVKWKDSNGLQDKYVFLNNLFKRGALSPLGNKNTKLFSFKTNFIDINQNFFKNDSIYSYKNFMDTNKFKGIGSKNFQKWVFKRSYYYYIYNKSFYMLDIANPWEWLHCIAHHGNISKESFTGWATNNNYSEKLYTIWKKNHFFFHDHKKCDNFLSLPKGESGSVNINNIKLKIDKTSPWQKFYDNINNKQSFKFNGVNYHKGTTIYDTLGYPEPPRYNLIEKLSPSPYRRIFKDKVYHTVGTLYDRKWLFYSYHDKKCNLNKSFINYFYISEPKFPVHVPTESTKVDLVFSQDGIIYPKFAWEINEVTGKLQKVRNYGWGSSPAQLDISPARNQFIDTSFRSKLYYERQKWIKIINDSSISQSEINKRFLARIEELQQEIYTYKIFEYRNMRENKKKVKFIMPDLGGNPIMMINPEGLDHLDNTIYLNKVYNSGNIFIGSYSHASPIVLSSVYNVGYIDVNTTS